MKLLVVEDSERLAHTLASAFRNCGHVVDVCGDGPHALASALARDYDLIVLDWMLPGIDGLEVLRELRRRGRDTHVLLLTAKDRVDERVQGLRGGADDYLVKPFALEELLARVEAVARRLAHRTDTRILIADLCIDTASKTATRAGVDLALTPREFRLLELLAAQRGKPVSRAELEARLYDQENPVWSNAVDSAVCALRAKLDRGHACQLLRTRRGLGYVLADAPPAEQERG